MHGKIKTTNVHSLSRNEDFVFFSTDAKMSKTFEDLALLRFEYFGTSNQRKSGVDYCAHEKQHAKVLRFYILQ